MDSRFEELIAKFPKLTFLREPRFQGLSEAKKQYLLGLVEDARFWLDLERKENPDDGFKFLGASFGLHKAQQDVKEKELTGKERERYLEPHQDLYTQYNPYSGRGHDD